MTVQLPGVEWIFIHGQPDGIGSITIHKRSGNDDLTIDAEGRWAETPGVDDLSIRAYAALAGRDEVEWAHQHGVKVHAVVACDRSTRADEDDLVTITGIDPYLDGTYRITALHPTAVHLRILLDTPTSAIEDV